MIIHHADRLHERIADGRADKFETALEQVFTHGIGFFGRHRNVLHWFNFVIHLLPADKLPNIGIKRAEFFLNLQKLFSILDCRGNFEAIADNASISKKPFNIFRSIMSNNFCVKSTECFAVIFTFIKDCLPRESCLGTFQNKKFEKCIVIMRRHAPFFVMVFYHELITPTPLTAIRFSIGFFLIPDSGFQFKWG